MGTKSKPTRMQSLSVVTADFESGMTNEQMSEKYDVALSAVSAYLQRNGLSRRQPKFAPDDMVIIEYLKLGWNCAQIAEKLDASPDRVSRYIRTKGLRAGIERQAAPVVPKGLQPTRFKVINAYGVSVPRIPTLHGPFEVRP